MPMPKSKPVEAGAKPKRKMATSADNAEALLPLALKKTADVGTNSKDRIPRSIRAGLDLPVGAIHRRLRHRCRGNRIHKNTPVFLAKVLEAMIIQAAGDAKKMNKRKRITVESLNLAVAQIWTDVWVHSGIPVPRINLPTGKKSWIGLRSIKQTDMSPTEPYSTTSASIASASASTAVKNGTRLNNFHFET
jgi:histone H3/H4